MNASELHLLLAQSASRAGGTPNSRVLFWVGVLIVFTLCAGLILVALRKKMFQTDDPGDEAASLMEELRRMRQRGELTEAEFNTARTAMSIKMKEAIDRRKSEREPKMSAQDRALIARARSTPDISRPVVSKPRPTSGEEPPRVAPPGADLTGAPLPKPRKDS